MRRNIGTIDAYARLFAGFFLFGLGLKDRRRTRSLFLMAFGANKLAEGITRFCPMLHMLGENTLSTRDQEAYGGYGSSGYGQWDENPYLTHAGDDPLAANDAESWDDDETEDGPVNLEAARRTRRPSGRRRRVDPVLG